LRGLSLLALISVVSLAACAGSARPGGAGAGGGATGGSASGAAAGGVSAGAGGASGTAGGGAGSGVAGNGVTGSGAGGASSTGVAGTGGGGSPPDAGAAGTTGGSGTGAVAGTGGTTPGFMDPGSEGDGDFMIGPQFKADPASTTVANVPVGHQITFKMLSTQSTIYPGTRAAYMRSVWVYVPQQYVPGTPAPVIVVQDGNYACWWGNDVPHAVNTGGNLSGTANLPRILDNYIAAGKLPKIVAVFADSGGGDGGNSERGLEYDTVSGVYAEYVQKEVLPRVVTEVQSQLKIALKFTDDPQGRATLGGSSGGAGSFSMVWWHPEWFARVITYSGTYVRQASPDNPLYPHGCWSYHDYDPYDPAAPNGLIVKEPAAKPIRMWLEAGQNDMGAGGGPTTYRDFLLANRRMAASLKAKGYHYHFDYAQNAGHLDGNAVAQTLPSALLWLWRGFPIN
jgi:enterochelin esterase family protein